MKLTFVLFLITISQLRAAVYAQKMVYKAHNVSLETLFKEIKKQTGYSVVYRPEILEDIPNINVEINGATITEILDQSLKNKPLEYLIVDQTVVIKRKIGVEIDLAKAPPKLLIGKVLDEHNLPIPQATVKIKNQSTGATTTNVKGEFSIFVPLEESVLQVTSIGYEPYEVATKALINPLTIMLKVSVSQLDQVQVLAYSSTTKRSNTGNSFTLKAEDIEKNPVGNVLQAIENQVPGMSMVQTTGQPGGAFTVRIRGINGYNNIDPLYVIDGVPYPAGGTNGNSVNISGGLPILLGYNNSAGSQKGGNALNYINPADIESIDVLKDADATAIYGSRGAYGVILITTKRAKAGKPTLNMNINQGVTVVGSSPQLLNTADYLMIRREALKNDNIAAPTANDLDLNGTWPIDRYTNWQKELYGNVAPETRVNGSYSGGSNGTNFLIGGSFDNQGDVQRAKGIFQDGGLRFNLNTVTPDQKLKIDLTSMFTSTVNTMVPYDFSNGTASIQAPNAPPLFLPGGALNWETGNNLANAIVMNYKGVTNNLLGSVNLTYNPIKKLTFRILMGYNLLSGSELRSVPTTYFSPTNTTASQQSNSNSNNYSIRTWDLDPNVNYTTKAGSKGKVSVTTGVTLQDRLINSVQVNGTGFLSDAQLNDPALGINITNTYTQTVNRYLGGFGIINYNWDNKFILDLNGRYDGSTKFGPGYRWGFFGSIAGVYIFTEEKWVKENLGFINFGKLRASYGTVGGDGINNYQYLSRYAAVGNTYLGNAGITNVSLANNDLHWEKNKKLDLGISLSFLKERITFDFSHYNNLTSDQLVSQPLASITGYTAFTLNTPAVIQNSGEEFALNTKNIDGKSFRWSSTVVFTLPRNELKSFPPGLVLPNSNFVVGLPVTNVKAYNYVGVNPQDGNYQFKNAAGVTGEYASFTSSLNQVTDRVANVDVDFKFFGSFTNTFSYKALSLGFTFSFVRKTGLNYMGQQSGYPGNFNLNESIVALGRWQKPGDITNVPRAATLSLASLFGQSNFRQSTGAYETILYSRLQNLNVSYALPPNLLKKLHVTSMRIVAQGQNLLTISKYGDLDPENLTAGAMPPLRVFNLGLNLTL